MTTLSPRVARTARTDSQDGFTLIELLIVVAMIAVLATIAFPILLRARITSNEGVAVASLRTIHSAQAAFSSSCGSGGYAQSLEDLALPAIGSSVGFIQEPLTVTDAVQNGYYASVMAANGASVVVVKAATCNGASADAMTAFVAERHPLSVSETGVRSFAIDTQGTMYMRQDGVEIDDALGGAIVFK